MGKNTIFYPPASDVIEGFVRSACFGLGSEYTNPDTMSGFADFMKVAARAYANNLSRSVNSEGHEAKSNPD